MIVFKKVIKVLYSVFAFIWAVFGAYGLIVCTLNIWKNKNESTSIYDYVEVGLLAFGLILISISLVLYIIKICRCHFAKKKLKHHIIWLVLNAIFICLIPDNHLNAIWYQLLGFLNNSPIIYIIQPFLKNEVFCVITMLNMLTIKSEETV